MVTKGLWDRLERMEHKEDGTFRTLPFRFVECHPQHPRHAEFNAYLENWHGRSDDPVIKKMDSIGSWEFYSADVADLPEQLPQTVGEKADARDEGYGRENHEQDIPEA